VAPAILAWAHLGIKGRSMALGWTRDCDWGWIPGGAGGQNLGQPYKASYFKREAAGGMDPDRAYCVSYNMGRETINRRARSKDVSDRLRPLTISDLVFESAMGEAIPAPGMRPNQDFQNTVISAGEPQ
jgi:hypothetical protein